MRSVQIVLLIAATYVNLYARGIPLDSLYINVDSPEYKKLVLTRLDQYQENEAQFVDTNVAFASWLSGTDIIYIKESGSNSTVYTYNTKLRKKTLVYQFKGTVISALTSPNGMYIAIKYFTHEVIPKPSLILLDIFRKKAYVFKTLHAGADYYFSHEGNSFFYNTKECINEFKPDSKDKPFLCSNMPEWNDINVYLHYPTGLLFISGSSGKYSIYIEHQQSFKKIGYTITPLEVFLLSAGIVFTAGTPGNYSVNVYLYSTEKTFSLMTGLLNPCLHGVGSFVLFLQNGFITLYNVATHHYYYSPIESDEAKLSPDTFYVASLLYNRLFVLPTTHIYSPHPTSRRYMTKLLTMYERLTKQSSLFTSPYSSTYIKKKYETITTLLEKM